MICKSGAGLLHCRGVFGATDAVPGLENEAVPALLVLFARRRQGAGSRGQQAA